MSLPGGDFVVIANDGHAEEGRKVAEEGAWREERRGSPVGPQLVKLHEMKQPFVGMGSPYLFKCFYVPGNESLPAFRVCPKHMDELLLGSFECMFQFIFYLFLVLK